ARWTRSRTASRNAPASARPNSSAKNACNATARRGRMIRFLIAALFAAYNLVPLYGIRHWGWDAFQLLILYWTETLILAAWTMVRIARLPEERLGTMTVNGKVVKATHRMMVGFFSLHAGMFVAVHLLFLCLLFSGDWFERLHGFGDFFHTFFIASG